MSVWQELRQVPSCRHIDPDVVNVGAMRRRWTYEYELTDEVVSIRDVIVQGTELVSVQPIEKFGEDMALRTEEEPIP